MKSISHRGFATFFKVLLLALVFSLAPVLAGAQFDPPGGGPDEYNVDAPIHEGFEYQHKSYNPQTVEEQLDSSIGSYITEGWFNVFGEFFSAVQYPSKLGGQINARLVCLLANDPAADPSDEIYYFDPALEYDDEPWNEMDNIDCIQLDENGEWPTGSGGDTLNLPDGVNQDDILVWSGTEWNPLPPGDLGLGGGGGELPGASIFNTLYQKPDYGWSQTHHLRVAMPGDSHGFNDTGSLVADGMSGVALGSNSQITSRTLLLGDDIKIQPDEAVIEDGYVLKATNDTGSVEWVSPLEIGGLPDGADINNVLIWNGTDWVPDSFPGNVIPDGENNGDTLSWKSSTSEWANNDAVNIVGSSLKLDLASWYIKKDTMNPNSFGSNCDESETFYLDDANSPTQTEVRCTDLIRVVDDVTNNVWVGESGKSKLQIVNGPFSGGSIALGKYGEEYDAELYVSNAGDISILWGKGNYLRLEGNSVDVIGNDIAVLPGLEQTETEFSWYGGAVSSLSRKVLSSKNSDGSLTWNSNIRTINGDAVYEGSDDQDEPVWSTDAVIIDGMLHVRDIPSADWAPGGETRVRDLCYTSIGGENWLIDCHKKDGSISYYGITQNDWSNAENYDEIPGADPEQLDSGEELDYFEIPFGVESLDFTACAGGGSGGPGHKAKMNHELMPGGGGGGGGSAGDCSTFTFDIPVGHQSTESRPHIKVSVANATNAVSGGTNHMKMSTSGLYILSDILEELGATGPSDYYDTYDGYGGVPNWVPYQGDAILNPDIINDSNQTAGGDTFLTLMSYQAGDPDASEHVYILDEQYDVYVGNDGYDTKVYYIPPTGALPGEDGFEDDMELIPQLSLDGGKGGYKGKFGIMPTIGTSLFTDTFGGTPSPSWNMIETIIGAMGGKGRGPSNQSWHNGTPGFAYVDSDIDSFVNLGNDDWNSDGDSEFGGDSAFDSLDDYISEIAGFPTDHVSVVNAQPRVYGNASGGFGGAGEIPEMFQTGTLEYLSGPFPCTAERANPGESGCAGAFYGAGGHGGAGAIGQWFTYTQNESTQYDSIYTEWLHLETKAGAGGPGAPGMVTISWGTE